MQRSNRRNFFLKALAGLGVVVSGAWIFRRNIIKSLFFNGDFDAEQLKVAPSISDNYCVLTSRQVEGPFFFPAPDRRNLVEDRKGVPLSLKFQVISHPDCTPVPGAVVEIWHCDAEGTYSGYPEEITHDIWKTAMFLGKNGQERDGQIHVDPINDTRFLRGRQSTDAEGWVAFDTIFPGWYEGRVPHVHLKVVTADQKQLMTQFYFDTELCNEIYTTHPPYDQYGVCPMQFEKDIVLFQGENADGLLLQIAKDETRPGALQGAAKIGMMV